MAAKLSPDKRPQTAEEIILLFHKNNGRAAIATPEGGGVAVLEEVSKFYGLAREASKATATRRGDQLDVVLRSVTTEDNKRLIDAVAKAERNASLKKAKTATVGNS